MSKRDIRDAYRNVLVHPADWALLCIYNPDGEKMISNRFPMGGVSIPFIFDTLSALTVFAIKNNVPAISQLGLGLFQHNGVDMPADESQEELDMLNILDDFLMIHALCTCDVEDGEKYARLQADAVDNIFLALGWPLKKEKSVTAVVDIIFLGVGWNSVEQACYIPDEKAEKYLGLLAEFLREERRLLPLKSWRSMCGVLVWTSFVTPQTKSRLYAPFQCLKAGERLLVKRPGSSPSSIMIRVSKEAMHDFYWWKEILQDPPLYRPMLQNDLDLEAWLLTTDGAPNFGIGGYWGNQYFSLELSPLGKSQHSTWVELFALVVASYLWGDEWTGQTIRWRTDCQAHVRGLFKIRTSAPKLLGLHDRLDALQYKKHFIFSSEHIPGKNNVLADELSRLCVENVPGDWVRCRKPTNLPRWLYLMLA